MAMLNIPSNVDDPSYRYKMPKIQSRKEGRGNGSKTGILNLGDVARALKRDPMYMTKFIGYELGAQSAYSNKENEGERVVINGHHEANVFQDLVDKFIQKYVLCHGCHLPEIDMIVKKGTIQAGCKACGWSGDLDNKHKLAPYIVKNPPSTGIGFDADKKKKEKSKGKKDQEDDGDETGSYKSETGKKDKKEKKEKKKKSKDEDDDSDDEEAKKTKKDKKDKKEKKKKSKDEEDGSDDESGDVKKKKKDKKEKKDKKSKKEKKEKKKEKNDDSDDDESSDDREVAELELGSADVKVIVADLIEHVEKKGDSLTPDALFEEVRALQVTKVFNNQVRMYVVVSSLFPEGGIKPEAVKAKKKFLLKFIQNGNMSFPEWIWGFEAYLLDHTKSRVRFPVALKTMYDMEMADEKTILEHYGSDKDTPGFVEAKKAAKKFLEWLEEDSESSSSGSGSDSD